MSQKSDVAAKKPGPLAPVIIYVMIKLVMTE